MDDTINNLVVENTRLKDKIKELEEQLKLQEDKIKKYTNSEAHKKYYEDHKEEVKKKGLEYLKKLKEENPEKLKEYRRNAYLRQKAKKELNSN